MMKQHLTLFVHALQTLILVCLLVADICHWWIWWGK